MNEKQVGGKHYQHLNPAPWDVVTAWGLGYLDGTALKYIARWKHKNGIEDIRKAIHFLEKLIEVELANPTTSGVERSNHVLSVPKHPADASATARLCSTNPCFDTNVWPGELNNLTIMRQDRG